MTRKLLPSHRGNRGERVGPERLVDSSAGFGGQAQSTRAPVALTTFAHFSISDRINSISCSGVLDLIVAPWVSMRARTALSSSVLFSSPLSRATIAAGVRTGTRMPHHVLASNPG